MTNDVSKILLAYWERILLGLAVLLLLLALGYMCIPTRQEHATKPPARIQAYQSPLPPASLASLTAQPDGEPSSSAFAPKIPLRLPKPPPPKPEPPQPVPKQAKAPAPKPQPTPAVSTPKIPDLLPQDTPKFVRAKILFQSLEQDANGQSLAFLQFRRPGHDLEILTLTPGEQTSHGFSLVSVSYEAAVIREATGRTRRLPLGDIMQIAVKNEE